MVARPAAEIPPVNVEVAEPVTARLLVVADVKAVDEANKVPVGPTTKFPTTVDEALEIKPPALVKRSATLKVLAMDEEAVDTKPP